MKRICVAIDFSDVTPVVIEKAIELAKKFKAQVKVIHIDYLMPVLNYYGVDQIYTVEAYEAQKERNKKLLEEIMEDFEKSKLKAESQLIEGNVVEGIIATAEDFEADLIIVGAHSHGKLYHIFFGCIHEALINKAFCPILVVPKHEEE